MCRSISWRPPSKHFPGDGRDERDQHLVTSINDFSCEGGTRPTARPYQACIDAGALTVMVGHIMQPAYIRHFNPEIKDEDMMPATLSPELMQGLLRDKLGFNGLICTDATSMAGFTIPMSREKAVPCPLPAAPTCSCSPRTWPRTSSSCARA